MCANCFSILTVRTPPATTTSDHAKDVCRCQASQAAPAKRRKNGMNEPKRDIVNSDVSAFQSELGQQSRRELASLRYHSGLCVAHVLGSELGVVSSGCVLHTYRYHKQTTDACGLAAHSFPWNLSIHCHHHRHLRRHWKAGQAKLP